MARGNKRDIGNVLLKKMRTKTTSPDANTDIGNVWATQKRIKQIEHEEQLMEAKKIKMLKNTKANFIRILSRPGILPKALVIIGLIISVVVYANTRGTEVLVETPRGTEVRGQGITDVDITNELPIVAEADIKLLFPEGKSIGDYDVRINSPPGNKQSAYVFQDKVGPDSTEILISQQEITDDFQIDEVASSFNLVSSIRIDESLIFHGTSKETGVQSLAFVKGNKLVLVTSSVKLTDDDLVNYYLSLK